MSERVGPEDAGGLRPWRLFVSLNPDPVVIGQLAAIQRTVRALIDPVATESGVRIGWVRPAQFHLTLAFLGPVAPALVEPLRAALAAVFPSGGLPELKLGGLGVFPAVREPAVLWIGVARDAQFEALVLDAGRRMATILGAAEHDRAYPHLTVARVREARKLDRGVLATLRERIELAREAVDGVEVAWRPRSIHLMRSAQGAGGVEHASVVEIRRWGD